MDNFSKNVILTHGLLAKSPMMIFLGYHLSRLGYRVHFFNYRTLHFNKEKTLKKLKRLCDSLDNIYFVGHSMGGLVLREFIQEYPSDKYKSIVTLGTPHNASSFAKMVSQSELNNLIGINDNSGLISNLRAYTGIPPLGSLAGNKSKGLFEAYSKLIKNNKDAESDGTILVEETQSSYFQDHITLSVSHSGMLVSHQVVKQIDYFFKNSKFKH